MKEPLRSPGSEGAAPPDIEFTEREGYLEARLSGDFRLERFKRQIEAIVQAAKDRGVGRVLVDFTKMTRFESVSTTDRFEMGTHAARLAGNSLTIAVLGRPPQFDPEQFGMQVAQNRGLKIRNFQDRAAAVAWLVGPAAGPEA